jgi:similar to stage IV sporulation protein
MKGFWTKPFYGTVHIQIIGRYTELFLNRCIEKGIPIWKIKRVSAECITAYIHADDAFLLRPLLRETGCKIRVLEKRGLPFFLRRSISRSGFVFGILFFLVVIFLLSNMVWNIEIKGTQPKIEHHLRNVIHEMGISKGKFLFLLPSVQDIQQEVTEQMDEATWIGVTLKGTTFQFNVVEKETPEEREKLSPRHLVARTDAVISNLFVEQGEAKVDINQAVKQGQLLVSGFIGKEGSQQMVPAKGEVWGEVWHQSNVTLPLKTNFNTYSGETQTTHYLSVFGLDIPIWGMWREGYKNFEIEKDKREFHFLKWKIPFAYLTHTKLEATVTERTYTVKEAVQVGKTMAKRELLSKLDDDAKIKTEKILHQSVENGTVKLEIYYKVIEEIASESPLIKEIE